MLVTLFNTAFKDDDKDDDEVLIALQFITIPDHDLQRCASVSRQERAGEPAL